MLQYHSYKHRAFRARLTDREQVEYLVVCSFRRPSRIFKGFLSDLNDRSSSILTEGAKCMGKVSSSKSKDHALRGYVADQPSLSAAPVKLPDHVSSARIVKRVGIGEVREFRECAIVSDTTRSEIRIPAWEAADGSPDSRLLAKAISSMDYLHVRNLEDRRKNLRRWNFEASSTLESIIAVCCLHRRILS